MIQSPIISIQKLGSETAVAELWQIAKMCLKLGKINQSLQLAYSITQKDPSQQQLYRKHYLETVKLGAEFAEEIGDHPRAAYYWEQLTQQLPQDATAWYGLGIAKANLQDYRSAEMALNRSLHLAPGNQKARNYLTEIQQLIQG